MADDKGYDPYFLEGFHVPLPTASESLSGKVYKDTDGGNELKYLNYSVAMNTETRAPLFAALNISQNELITTKRNDDWKMDPRVPTEFQLGNEYYADRTLPDGTKEYNHYDKGHLAMRQAAGWGRNAQEAADDTFYYTNCALQHKNLNRDEWLKLEKWTMEHESDIDGKMCEFSGPFFEGALRYIAPLERKKRKHDDEAPSKGKKAPIPTGFFKLVAFKNHNNGLEVRAFIIRQDEDTLSSKSSKGVVYQVTTAEIEKLTGLRFDESLARANPLYYHNRSETQDARHKLHVGSLPEQIELADSADIVGSDTVRDDVPEEETISGIYIAGALINPLGPSEHKNEWISIINLSAVEIDLNGWFLRDTKHRLLELSGPTLQPGEAAKITDMLPMRLSNTSGSICLLNPKKQVVHRFKYHNTVDGVPTTSLSLK